MQNEQLFYTFMLSVIAIIFGYTLTLDKRTVKLEKKNGHEQHQIDELKKKIEELERKDIHSDNLIKKLLAENKSLHEELRELKEQLAKYQNKRKAIKEK